MQIEIYFKYRNIYVTLNILYFFFTFKILNVIKKTIIQIIEKDLCWLNQKNITKLDSISSLPPQFSKLPNTFQITPLSN